MSKIKLSIITINLNSADGLKKTIESVANQSYSYFEHIIIDGGSSDNSVNIIKENKDKYSNIHGGLYWISEPDKGIYNAMNKGIKVAKGEYCLFLNSGDTLYSHKTLHLLLKKNIVNDFVFCSVKQIYPNGFCPVKKHQNITLAHFSKYSIGHQGVLIKTNVFRKTGLYCEDYKIAGDYHHFLYSIALNIFTYEYHDLILTIYPFDGISSLPSSAQLLQEEKHKAQKEISSEQLWKGLNNSQDVIDKYNGLINSGIIKVALKLIQIKNKIVSKK